MLVDKVDAFAHLILWISIGLSTGTVLQKWFAQLLRTFLSNPVVQKKKVSGIFFFDNFFGIVGLQVFF